MNEAEIVRAKPLTMQVCVSEKWSKEEIEKFANKVNPSGISSKWEIVEEDDTCLNGDPLRVPCDDKEGYIHTVLGV